jgi:dTDP-4-dehydrorhamnose reductase
VELEELNTKASTNKSIKVAILGSTGMLGSMVRLYLGQKSCYSIYAPSRKRLDAEWTSVDLLADLLRGQDYAINCIGIIKPRIDETFPASVLRALHVNALFPHLLATAAERTGCRVLQIATDCVYSGRSGDYDENSPHDALDVYGKTKSIGEVRSPAVRHLRCSIIGPEGADRPKDSLLEWFLGQPAGSMIKGFTNHHWNGITTLAFARLCHGIMSADLFYRLQPVQHIVPRNTVTKAGLLSHFAYFYRRDDISFGEVAAPVAVDRSLTTCSPDMNERLWRAAGYDSSPCIQQMIEEMAAYQ